MVATSGRNPTSDLIPSGINALLYSRDARGGLRCGRSFAHLRAPERRLLISELRYTFVAEF